MLDNLDRFCPIKEIEQFRNVGIDYHIAIGEQGNALIAHQQRHKVARVNKRISAVLLPVDVQ